MLTGCSNTIWNIIIKQRKCLSNSLDNLQPTAGLVAQCLSDQTPIRDVTGSNPHWVNVGTLLIKTFVHRPPGPCKWTSKVRKNTLGISGCLTTSFLWNKRTWTWIFHFIIFVHWSNIIRGMSNPTFSVIDLVFYYSTR